MTNAKNAPLGGKVIIITGASRGIGRAIAQRVAREGSQVILVARDADLLATVVNEISQGGGEATAVPADLSSVDVPAKVVEAALRSYGSIDGIVNNAGSTKRGDFLELTEADWMEGFGLKFFGAVRLSRAAWPHLKRAGGSVLNIIGVGGRTPGASFTIGGSVNGAFLSFTKALADIGIRDGVQVNAINPGWVRTDRFRATLEKEALNHKGDLAAAERKLSLQADIVRIGEPEDVANLAAYILSPQSRLLQGALIDLDGGMTKTI